MPGTLERASEQLVTLGEVVAYPEDAGACILLVQSDYSPTLSLTGLNTATIRRVATLTDGTVLKGAAFAFLDESVAETFITNAMRGEGTGFEYPFGPEDLKRRIDEPILLIHARLSDSTWSYTLNP